MTLPRTYFRATESALYAYPRVKKQRTAREHFIEAVLQRCTVSLAIDKVDGCGASRADGPQEAIVIKKEEDYTLQILQVKEATIQKALEVIEAQRPQLLHLIELKYFKGLQMMEILSELNISRREYFRMRREAVEIVAPFVCGVFAMQE